MTDQVSDVGAQVAPGNSVPAEAVAEKMVPQSKVDEVAREAHLRGRQAALKEMSQVSPVMQQQPASAVAIPSADPQAIQAEVQKGIQQHMNAIQGQQIVSQFRGKMLDPENAKRHPDFDKKFDGVDWNSIPDIVHLANGVDNTADVMVYLQDHPEDKVILRQLNQMNPRDAERKIATLSSSIKLNQQAALDAQKQSPEPLSQLKHSTTGASNGKMSAADYRNADWTKA